MPTEIPITNVAPARFAPGVDIVQIDYSAVVANRFPDFTLEVVDRNGVVVYTQLLGALAGVAMPVNHILTWNGALQGNAGFVNPLGSPYRIRLWGHEPPAAVVHQPRNAVRRFFGSVKGSITTLVAPLVAPTPPVCPVQRVEVRFHSIALSIGEAIPAEALQNAVAYVAGFAGGGFAGINLGDARTVEWVWAKLTALGYWAGPHTTVRAPNDELGRAIRRYRQAHGDLYQRLIHYDGVSNDYAIDPGVDAQLTAIDAALLAELDAGTNDRMAAGPDSVMTDTGWLDPGHDTRLYVDVDRYYIGTDETMNGHKAAVERDWVPRPRIPIRARIFLEDAAGNPVVAPDRTALGDVRVEWTWDDEAEDHSNLAVPSPAQPSYTRAYVTAAKQAVAAAIPAHFENARTAVGGIVSGTGADLAAAFEASPHFEDFSAPNTPIVTGGARDPNHASAASDTLVFFRPSNIGGDRFTLTATLDVPAHAHVGVPAQIRKTTSSVTIWRRARMAAYLRWGGHAPLPNWNGVRAQFEPAYLHLCDPVVDDTIANLPGGTRAALAAAVDNSFAGNTPAGAPLTSRTPSVNAADYHYRFDTNHVFSEDPRTLEFQQLFAIGVGQFGDPKDIVNQLMIEPLRPIMTKFRSARNPPGYKQPKAAQLVKRRDLATLWSNDGRAWVQAIGNHFLGQLGPLLNGAALQMPACPADRVIAPLPAAAIAAAPASRAAILDALLLDPVRPILDAWMQGNPLPPAGPLTTVSAFLRVLSQDLAEVRRESWPVNPMIERALNHYAALIRDRVGRPASMMNPAITLKNHDIEAWIPSADQVAFAAGLGPFNLNVATVAVAGADYQLNRLTHTNAGAFNAVAFAAHVATHNGTHDLLRGPGAALPAFVVADEARMNAIHLEQLVEAEKFNTTQQLGAYGVFTDILVELDDMVHAQNPRPPGGLIVVHYAAHPRPVRLESGSGIDIVDFSNSTSMGMSGGIVFVSNDQPLRQNHLFAHEIGHCLFMRHWQKGEDGITAQFSVAEDHDHADSNCIMSYSAFERTTCHTHFDPNSYDPHFCGKCVLKLRGWDIAATHGVGPLLPASSQALTPVFPNVPAVTAVTTDIPDLGVMDTELHNLATALGINNIVTYPHPFPDQDSLRFFEHGAAAVRSGRTVFARQPLAVTQRPSGTVLPATTMAWEHGDPVNSPADADLLHVANTHVAASWEENVQWYIHKGGATNCSAPPPAGHITFNTTSPRYYDACTPFHEIVHFYQKWDQSLVYEGITEVFAGMLTHRYVTAHNPGPGFVWALNPSYLQMTQFTVDELLPRLGIDGLATLYFDDPNGNILKPILQPGVDVRAFTNLCVEGIARYDMSDAAAALLPIGARPPVTPPNPAVAVELAATLQSITNYFTNNTPAVVPPVPAAGRAQAATLLRLRLKVDVWKDTVAMAQSFRGQVSATNRIHRLERAIEQSNADLADFRRRYAAFGGNPADVA